MKPQSRYNREFLSPIPNVYFQFWAIWRVRVVLEDVRVVTLTWFSSTVFGNKELNNIYWKSNSLLPNTVLLNQVKVTTHTSSWLKQALALSDSTQQGRRERGPRVGEPSPPFPHFVRNGSKTLLFKLTWITIWPPSDFQIFLRPCTIVVGPNAPLPTHMFQIPMLSVTTILQPRTEIWCASWTVGITKINYFGSFCN